MNYDCPRLATRKNDKTERKLCRIKSMHNLTLGQKEAYDGPALSEMTISISIIMKFTILFLGLSPIDAELPKSSIYTTHPTKISCVDSKKYYFRGNCNASHPSNCDSWNRYGKLMKNHCPKKCNFCGLERCVDDESFFLNGVRHRKNKCSELSTNDCKIKDRLGRIVKEFCRGLCNICAKKNKPKHMSRSKSQPIMITTKTDSTQSDPRFDNKKVVSTADKSSSQTTFFFSHNHTNWPSHFPTKWRTNAPMENPSSKPTKFPTIDPTALPIKSPSNAPTRSATNRPTIDPSFTPTSLPTNDPTVNPTKSPSTMPTYLPTDLPTVTPSNDTSTLPTSLPTKRPTTNPSIYPSSKPTILPTNQPTGRPTQFPSNSPSHFPTNWPTRTPSKIPSRKPTKFPTTYPTALTTKSPTKTPSHSPTNRPTNNPSVRPSLKPTYLPTVEPTVNPTNSPSSTPTDLPTDQPTVIPSSDPSSLPTSLPTKRPTINPSMYPSSKPTILPTNQPSGRPTQFPSNSPSHFPTNRPTRTPSEVPSSNPTNFPTTYPTALPTQYPSNVPTRSPTNRPTVGPSVYPSFTPTSLPTTGPTVNPTKSPSTVPTYLPTDLPTDPPTVTPSNNPSNLPTSLPTSLPTKRATTNPSVYPSSKPTILPTNQPSGRPTQFPSNSPTRFPTNWPTKKPTKVPSGKPTNLPRNDPTSYPTKSPSNVPTYSPTDILTVNPTKSPTKSLSNVPTYSPTYILTVNPTKSSSSTPTYSSTNQLTSDSIKNPSGIPSHASTNQSSTFPTDFPSNLLTHFPTNRPTNYTKIFSKSILAHFPQKHPTVNTSLSPSRVSIDFSINVQPVRPLEAFSQIPTFFPTYVLLLKSLESSHLDPTSLTTMSPMEPTSSPTSQLSIIQQIVSPTTWPSSTHPHSSTVEMSPLKSTSSQNSHFSEIQPIVSPMALPSRTPHHFSMEEIKWIPSRSFEVESPKQKLNCFDSVYYYHGKNCEVIDVANCDAWNHHGELMKNHCPKKCNFCGRERCLDDETFYLNGISKTENKCSQLSRDRCTIMDQLGRKVNEFCRNLCDVCKVSPVRSPPVANPLKSPLRSPPVPPIQSPPAAPIYPLMKKIMIPTNMPLAPSTAKQNLPCTNDHDYDKGGKCTDLNSCDSWDEEGKLTKNYCAKSCNFCGSERCLDDKRFYFDGFLLYKNSCQKLSIWECGKIDRLGRKVREFCRKTCKFCENMSNLSEADVPHNELPVNSPAAKFSRQSPTDGFAEQRPTSTPTFSCVDSKTYVNGLSCLDLHPKKCNSWNRSGHVMKNHCSKKCNFCGPERCEDDKDFYYNALHLERNNCKNIPKYLCRAVDRLGRLVSEHCRGLCNYCSIEKSLPGKNDFL